MKTIDFFVSVLIFLALICCFFLNIHNIHSKVTNVKCSVCDKDGICVTKRIPDTPVKAVICSLEGSLPQFKKIPNSVGYTFTCIDTPFRNEDE